MSHIADTNPREATAADLAWIAGMRSEPSRAPPPKPAHVQSLPTGTAQTPPGPPTHQQASPAPAPPARPGFVYEPIACDNALDFHDYFWPDFPLFAWQEATLLQLSGFPNGHTDDEQLLPTAQTPLHYNLVAANGSGKSAIIVARFALWFIATKNNSLCVATSATFDQLKDMTFRAIERAALEINDFLGEPLFECTELKVVCTKTRSMIRGFATDKPGRAEGWHPEPGGEMAVIVDEAKTITDEMFGAFSRFTGYNFWLEVSSPGPMIGHFYERYCLAKEHAVENKTDTLLLGRVYNRKVTAFECPANKNGGIPQSHIDYVKAVHGENSAWYRSSILAEFTSLEDGAIIRLEITRYNKPPHVTLDLPITAGLDLSLGGDETVLSVWHGNKRIAQPIWHEEDSAVLRDKVIAAFKQHGLQPSNINADAGGLGKVVIQMIQSAGWPINRVNNESPALFKREFLNRGMEMYWKLLRLIEEQYLILPTDDVVLMRQLTTRQAVYRGGKLKLQSKAELTKSPDRADAMALAFAQANVADILLKWSQWKSGNAVQEPADGIRLIGPPTKEQLEAFIEKRREQEVPRQVGSVFSRLSAYGNRCGVRTAPFATYIRNRHKPY